MHSIHSFLVKKKKKESTTRHLSFWLKKLSCTFLSDKRDFLCIKSNSLFIRFNIQKHAKNQYENNVEMESGSVGSACMCVLVMNNFYIVK